MLGYDSLEELKKVNSRDLYADPRDRERFLQLAQAGPVKNFEEKLKRKNGEVIDILENSYAVKNPEGRIVGRQGVVVDVSDRKRIEEMRDRFISTVTHELRTPLVSIKGYVDLALSEKPGSMSKEVEGELLVAKRNTDRLLSLVNDLLDVQRMQAGRLELNLQATDLKKIIDSCIVEIQPMLTEKKMSLKLEVSEAPMPIQGDPVRLSQVLMNLLSNAAKFSPEGGEVTVHVEEETETIKLSVADVGIGIRPEDLGRLFEPFSAIQQPSWVKGTGLGLSISKGLVEAHGGKIWAESAGEGKGATFTFTLPKLKEAT
jgi:signal transduction histidine kinase